MKRYMAKPQGIVVNEEIYVWVAHLVVDCEGHFRHTHIWKDDVLIYKKLSRGIDITPIYIEQIILSL